MKAITPAILARRDQSFAIDPAQRALITDPKHVDLLAALGKIAMLPAIVLLCYLVLIGYFKATGGYRAQHLVAEGVPGD